MKSKTVKLHSINLEDRADILEGRIEDYKEIIIGKMKCK